MFDIDNDDGYFVWEDELRIIKRNLKTMWDFWVTDDILFMIPDYKAGKIKIYERDVTKRIWTG